MTLKVFISYAREDVAHAREYYRKLLNAGYSPWLDEENILPGQDWEHEIDRAARNADVVMLLMSDRSVSKQGFVQREAKEAVSRLKEKREGDIYIIPVLLNDCTVPDFIARQIQYINAENAGAWQKVESALGLASQQRGITPTPKDETVGPLRYSIKKLQEQVEGYPGHDIDISYPVFVSDGLPEIARDLSRFFAGRAVEVLIASRPKPWEQSQEAYSAEDLFLRTDGRWDSFRIDHIGNRIASFVYDVSWYGAGAAHPNHDFQTYTFSFVDRLILCTLQDFFVNPDKAIEIISASCIKQLERQHFAKTEVPPAEYDIAQFTEGASPNYDNFSSFTVREDHFRFLFPPYQVSCYALGSWEVSIPFYDLRDVLDKNGPYSYVREQ